MLPLDTYFEQIDGEGTKAVTVIVGMIDLTGIADAVNAGVCILEGDYTAATIAVASIAVPFGAEKLAKAVRRAPIGQVDTLTKSMNTAADLAKGRVDEVAQESGELAGKAVAKKTGCQLPGASSCFRDGTMVLMRDVPLKITATNERDYDVLIAAGALGAMIVLTAKPPASSTEKRRRKRGQREECKPLL